MFRMNSHAFVPNKSELPVSMQVDGKNREGSQLNLFRGRAMKGNRIEDERLYLLSQQKRITCRQCRDAMPVLRHPCLLAHQ